MIEEGELGDHCADCTLNHCPDINFPVLPRWYTNELKAWNPQLTSVHLPDGTPRSEPLSPPPTPLQDDDEGHHDHALLESLFNSVFETRFINTKPTCRYPHGSVCRSVRN